jgi:hypothetical protein
VAAVADEFESLKTKGFAERGLRRREILKKIQREGLEEEQALHRLNTRDRDVEGGSLRLHACRVTKRPNDSLAYSETLARFRSEPKCRNKRHLIDCHSEGAFTNRHADTSFCATTDRSDTRGSGGHNQRSGKRTLEEADEESFR